MTALPIQQQHHDTLAEREEAAHPTPFDMICDRLELAVVCALASGVVGFVLGVVATHLQRYY